MDYLKRAEELFSETKENRRYIHKNAETGFDLPKTTVFISEKLKSYGINPIPCGKGITATIGNGSPTILLRADMDALPMKEESGEEFRSENGNAHTCGHDMHSAMLLTAARMLKETETELMGMVKLMFQPAEELLLGSKNMIENGILLNPKPDVALAFHTAAGKIPTGKFMYNNASAMMSAVRMFRIETKGKGGHGAYPHLSTDALFILFKIYSALSSLVSKEGNPDYKTFLTIGKISAGTAPNIIPESAFMEGSLRSDDNNEVDRIFSRIKEISEYTAKAFKGTVKVTLLSETPVLLCDEKITDLAVKVLSDKGFEGIAGMKAAASEDFSFIAEKIPSAMIYLSSGFSDERGEYTAHNPKVAFDEEVLKIGAYAYAETARRFLSEK
ncbi:MAG: amidohydrolase [Oscillospiraceae bacterium]|nr:amidohydrolase [Oscillospiraceae bacterium]